MSGRAAETVKRIVKTQMPVGAQDLLRRQRAAARRPMRALARRRRTVVDADSLAGNLRAAGIGRGHVLMVHSALSRIGNVEGGADAVLQSLAEAVGDEGTILMPTYSDADAFVRSAQAGRILDLRTERSLTGKVTDRFRTTAGTLRSSHPFSSVAARGAAAGDVVAGHAEDERIAHARSPMGRLHALGGTVVGLGVDLGPVSFYHVLEDTWPGFPFDPYLPAESFPYLDPEGALVTRPVRRYRPDVGRKRIDHADAQWIRARLTERFDRTGIRRRFSYGEAAAWTIDTRSFYDDLKHLAERGITIYLTEAEWQAIGRPPF